MSEFRVNSITNQDGSAGPQVCGISTFSGKSGIQIPSGSSNFRNLDGSGRGRAIHAGGSSFESRMEVHSITSGGGGKDFGDLSVAMNRPHGCSSSTRGIYAGGKQTPGVEIAVIQYVTISSLGGVADFGDLLEDVSSGDAASNDTRGIISAGYDAPANINTIQFITIASTGNARDFCDGLENRGQQCFSSTTRYVSGGGYGSPNYAGTGSYAYLNIIDFLTFSTKSNPKDFGDLSVSAYGANGGTSSSTRGIFANLSVSPGTRQNIIEFVTIATTGNTTDFGDMTSARAGGGTGDSTRAIFLGGSTNPAGAASNVIDQITIASAGNASDFGDLLFTGKYATSISDSHGGLAQ